jgi:hypothetical protein
MSLSPFSPWHRGQVNRVIRSREILDRLFRPAVHTRDPGIRSSIRPVRVTRPNPGQVSSHDLVGVFLELTGQLVLQCLAAACAFARLTSALRCAPFTGSNRVLPE